MKHLLRTATVVAAGLVGVSAVASGATAASDDTVTVSGTVTGLGGAPLEGATVVAGAFEGDRQDSDLSDANGRYTLHVPANRNIDVWFDKSGYRKERFLGSGSSDPDLRVREADIRDVSVHLTASGTVSGRVLDDAGRPVVGESLGLDGEAFTSHGGRVPDEYTDGRGRFSFESVPEGRSRLSFPSAPQGLLSTLGTVTVSRPGQVVDLGDLRAQRDLRGRVALRVDISPGGPPDGTWPLDLRSVEADGASYLSGGHLASYDGATAVFEDVPVGRYKIAYGDRWLGGRSFDTATTVSVASGRTTRVGPWDVTGRSVSISTDLKTTRGAHVGGVRVLVRRLDEPTEIVAWRVSHAGSEAGTEIEQLPAAEYRIDYVDPAGRYEPVSKVWDARDGGRLFPGPVLKRRGEEPPPRTGSETWTARAGARVLGAWTAGAQPYFEHDDSEPASVDQDSDEQVVYWAVPPGRYKFRMDENTWLGGKSFESATVFDVGPGRTVVDSVVAPPRTGLSGIVRSDDGRYVQSAEVTVFDVSDETTVVARKRWDTPRSLVEGMPLGPYKIRVSDPQGRFATRWYGGGSSFATAEVFTPDVGEFSWFGTITLPSQFKALSGPRIVGTPAPGKRLTATTPVYGKTGAKLSKRWYRNGKAIKGATSSAYRVKSSDVGKKLTYRVVAKRSGEKVVTTSQPVVVRRK